MIYSLKNLEDVSDFAKEFVSFLLTINKKESIVVLLEGDLGVGKTTFVKECAKILGVKEDVISPTFVILKTYQTANNTIKKLVHIDAYRIIEDQSYQSLKLEEYLAEQNTLLMIEWPLGITGAIPENNIKINFSYKDNMEREAVVSYEGK